MTGVDISPVAIECAQEKAEKVGLDVRFVAADAFGLAEAGVRYDTVLDSAFFHTLPRTEIPAYLALLDAITQERAQLHLFTFATELTPDFPGPRRSSAVELRTDFEATWKIHSISSRVTPVRCRPPRWRRWSTRAPSSWTRRRRT